MKRSKWKGPFFSKGTIFKKNFTITPNLVNSNVKIYTGKKFLLINITEEMIGYKIGEFLTTREKFEFKKKKKKK